MRSPTIRSPARRSRHARFNATWMALLWPGLVILLALEPFPWW